MGNILIKGISMYTQKWRRKRRRKSYYVACRSRSLCRKLRKKMPSMATSQENSQTRWAAPWGRPLIEDRNGVDDPLFIGYDRVGFVYFISILIKSLFLCKFGDMNCSVDETFTHKHKIPIFCLPKPILDEDIDGQCSPLCCDRRNNPTNPSSSDPSRGTTILPHHIILTSKYPRIILDENT